MAIHPSRQAMVEEDHEVRHSKHSLLVECANVHTTISVGRRHAHEEETGVDINNIPLDASYTITDVNGAQQQSGDVLSDFAKRRKIANIPVPTDDKRVRLELRARGQPITLFGERPEDRRDRLREALYAERGDQDEEMPDASAAGQGNEDQEEEFYTEGSAALLEARRDIARYCLPRSKRKLAYQKVESRMPVSTHVKHRDKIKEKLKTFELFGSQIASERAVAITRFSPDGQTIACGDWSGSLKLLDVPNLETKMTLRGHTGMIGGVAWYPGAAVSTSSVNLASTGGEGEIHLWSLEQDTPLSTLSGHTGRAVRCAFHPSGQFLASASYDTTWRLWDVQTTTELLLQEGHSKEVFTVAFNDEGSLLASAGLDSIGRIWDMRTGRTIMFLDAHIQPIHALDWSPDGYRVLTGSADGFAKCWDIRAVKETASIGAHRGGVTDLRWFRGHDGPLSGLMPDRVVDRDEVMTNGQHDADARQDDDEEDNPALHYIPRTSGSLVVTSGFDKKVNIFSADDWAICASMTGHDGAVLAADVNDNASYIASCGRDRTVKLWSRPDGQGL